MTRGERIVLRTFSMTRHRGARILGLLLAGTSLVGLWRESRADAATTPAVGRTGARALLRFEPNAGQFEAAARFVARGAGFTVSLTSDAAILSLPAGKASAQFGLRIAGARHVEPRGIGQLPGHTNYFTDRVNLERVPSFGRVRYDDVLPGIDVEYYASEQRELEYDFFLAPGTDPAQLRLELDGIAKLGIDARGDAVLELADGSRLRKTRPVAYQVDDSGVRRFVPARFLALPPSALGIEVAAYDASRELVIDPVLSYSSYLGGSRFDEFFAVAADATGNTYAVGYTTGTLFPTHAPAQAAYGGGASDAVIVKLSAAGNNFTYATYLGGSDGDRAYAVAVDGAGSAYISGLTFSSNFPTAGSPLQASLGGGQDAFVAKLSATGSLIYSTYLGGSGDDLGQAIAVRPTGEAYVAGTTFSTGFPKVGALQSTLGGTNDAFVSKLSANGDALVYSTLLGGSGAEYGQAIAVDASGAAYVTGQTGSSNFPVLSGFQSAFGGAISDAFVSKLTPTGSALGYSTYLGGSAADVATGIALLGGAALVTGTTSSFNFPTANAQQSTFGGGSDAFVTRVAANGSALDFSTYLGGLGADSASAITVDSSSFVYLTGQTASNNFPVESPLPGGASSAGGNDAFLVAFTAGGTRMYSTYFGGSASDAGVGIAVGPPNLLHLLGNTFSPNIPTQAPLFASPVGVPDGFVARLPTATLVAAPWGLASSRLLLAGLLAGLAMFALSRPRQWPIGG